jgi:hypothetical protein
MSKAIRKQAVKRRSASDRYVVPNPTSGWDIIKEGHRRATGHADTKVAAVRDARSLLRKEGGGELRVLNRSGKVTTSDTVSPR